jgi:osmotically-inducible protein OsmY
MEIRRSTSRVLWATLLAAVLAACQNTAEGVKKDARESADKAADAVADVAKKAADAATAAGEKAAEASKQAGAAVAAATNTVDVKAALLADETIDASSIDVDTDARTHTVILKGSVPSAEQKTLAGNVAASKARGYKIVNQLEVIEK